MATTRVIRYQTTPESSDENERLVRAVFAELAGSRPDGLRYGTFRLADGVTFVHVAVVDDDATNPLSASEAFAAFQAGINARCADGPTAAEATLIGSYRLAL
jgi:hypothetical protein